MRGRRSGERSRADAKTHLLARRLRVLASSAGHPGGFGTRLGVLRPLCEELAGWERRQCRFQEARTGAEKCRSGAPRGAPGPRHGPGDLRRSGDRSDREADHRVRRFRTSACRRSAPLIFCGSGERQWAPPLPKRAAERWLHTGHSGAGRSREPGIHKHRTGEWNAGGATRRELWLWIPGPALARRPGMTVDAAPLPGLRHRAKTHTA